jgi:lysozyme
MEIKSMDQAGLDFLAKEEGLRLKPYLDSVGIPTIGIGSTRYEDGRRVTMKDPAITRERAFELFRNTLKHYETAVWSVTRDDINQSQFNALTSLCYNIGEGAFRRSTLLRRLNAGASRSLISQAWLMWIKPKELLGRRKREVALYYSLKESAK